MKELAKVTTLALMALSATIAEARTETAPTCPEPVPRCPESSHDWGAEPDALRHFQSIVRMDTSEPDGNEAKVVNYLKTVLESSERISFHVTGPVERPSLVARLEGNGTSDPILIMGHTDVVPANRRLWIPEGDDPFSGCLKEDCYVYGRGTLDDKVHVVAGLMILLGLEQNEVQLDRDVIFLAGAGEEGFPSVGAEWITKNDFDSIDSEFCFAEGGVNPFTIEDGKKTYRGMVVQTQQRSGYRVDVKAVGSAGRGSSERHDNAIAALSKAVAAIFDWQQEEEPPSSLAVTIIGADNSSINVIPAEATASFDMRAVPEENLEYYLAKIQGVIDGTLDPLDEDSAKVTAYYNICSEGHIPKGCREERPLTKTSDTYTDAFRAIERSADRHYGIEVIDRTGTGSTDMAYLREVVDTESWPREDWPGRAQCYGTAPATDFNDRDLGYTAHGNGERLLAEELHRYIDFLYDVVVELAAAP